jgi:hypothetical protein
VNSALRFTLLALALVVVLFAVTWITLPSDDTDDVTAPASVFTRGLTKAKYGCLRYRIDIRGDEYCSMVGQVRVGTSLEDSDAINAARTRVVVFYGSLAVVVVLVGVAFGAGRRSSSAASPDD